MTLGKEAGLVTSDNTLQETGRNLDKKWSEKSYRRIPGQLTLKKRASIAAPDCVLSAGFPTTTPPSLVPLDHSPPI